MAVAHRRIDITREEVQAWLDDYKGQQKKTIKLRTYLEGKIAEKELPDEMVDVSLRDDIPGTEIHVVDMILEDLGAYGTSS
jgi:hypothetical protein